MKKDNVDIKWMSPVEKVGDLYFKREDKFIPFPADGNANGSKLRVCIWLIQQAIASGARGVIHGAVTGSPQHVFVSNVCKHYDIPCVSVVGSTDFEKHPNLAIAKSNGSTFEVCKVGYAKTLEATAYKLAEEKYSGYFVLETNITVAESKNAPARVEAFQNVGAYQVQNMPDHIETVIVPCGSCNSVTSVLYGIAQKKPKNLKRVVLMGIGNYGSKDPDYIRRRLDYISQATTTNVHVFDFPFKKEETSLPFTFDEFPYIIEHHDLNGTGYCQYSDLMPFNYHGITFHPRYEGKIWNYMKDNPKKFDKYMNDKTMFWIVGGPIA